MLNYLSACAQPGPCKTVRCLPPSSRDAFFSPIPPFLALGSWHCALATSPSGSRVPTFFFCAFLKIRIVFVQTWGALNRRPDFILCFTPHLPPPPEGFSLLSRRPCPTCLLCLAGCRPIRRDSPQEELTDLFSSSTIPILCDT